MASSGQHFYFHASLETPIVLEKEHSVKTMSVGRRMFIGWMYVQQLS
jgi:hypothetical protein